MNAEQIPPFRQGASIQPEVFFALDKALGYGSTGGHGGGSVLITLDTLATLVACDVLEATLEEAEVNIYRRNSTAYC